MPQLSSFPRLVQRIASRSHDYSLLRSARSRSEVSSFAARKPSQLFNGNALRAKITQAIVGISKCGCFIETGTSHAATAIGARRCFDLPVLSCENSWRDYLISRIVTLGMTGISLFNLDSREFLLRTIPDMKKTGAIPFILMRTRGSSTTVLFPYLTKCG